MALLLKPTDNTPEIKCSGGIISIKGRSFPENAEVFYKPLLLELEQYLRKPLDETKLIFQLEYVNSSTKFMIVEICKKLGSLKSSGYSLTVEYHCSREDEIIIELFEELSSIIQIPFTHIDSEVK